MRCLLPCLLLWLLPTSTLRPGESYRSLTFPSTHTKLGHLIPVANPHRESLNLASAILHDEKKAMGDHVEVKEVPSVEDRGFAV